MKFIAFVFLVFAALTSSSQNLSFLKTKHDFGKMVKGKIDTMNFRFVNSGNAALTLKEGVVECDCTTPVLPQRSFAPGDSGTVTVIYDSKDSYELQDREVIVYSNSLDGPQTIRFYGEVIEPTADPHAAGHYKGKLSFMLNRTEVFSVSGTTVKRSVVLNKLYQRGATDTVTRGYLLDQHGKKFNVFSSDEFRKENIEPYYAGCDSALQYSRAGMKLLKGKDKRDRITFLAPLGIAAASLAGSYATYYLSGSGPVIVVPLAVGIPAAYICYRTLKRKNQKRYVKGIMNVVRSVEYFNDHCAN